VNSEKKKRLLKSFGRKKLLKKPFKIEAKKANLKERKKRTGAAGLTGTEGEVREGRKRKVEKGRLGQ